MNNKKVIQRAVAVSLVRDTSETIKLIRKYQPISNNISYLGLLIAVDNLLVSNKKFAKDYYIFLVAKKRLVDYNYRTVIGTAIVGGIASIAGGLFQNSAQKKAGELQNKQITAQNTQAMMQMMMQEDALLAQKKKQDNNLIIGAVAAMFVFTGFIIYVKNK